MNIICKEGPRQTIGWQLMEGCKRAYGFYYHALAYELVKPLKRDSSIVCDDSMMNTGTNTIFIPQDNKPRPFSDNIASSDFMPDINLYRGFAYVVHLACKHKGNMIDKKEKRDLFVQYKKACNKHQLIVLNQIDRPFSIGGGSVWSLTNGSINIYMDMVKKHIGRKLTLKETNVIKPQYQELIRKIRETKTISNTTPTGKQVYNGEPNLWNRLMQEGGDILKAAILASVTTNKKLAKNIVSPLTFDYSQAKKDLKKQLEGYTNNRGQYIKPSITHAQYNLYLKRLKQTRQDVLAFLKSGDIPLRHRHKNSGSIHVNNNVKGREPSNDGVKRYGQEWCNGEMEASYNPEIPDYRKSLTRGITSKPATKTESVMTGEQFHIEQKEELQALTDWFEQQEQSNPSIAYR